MNAMQIEAGLDRVTVSAPAIREMTGFGLQESARGLEPRIVRSIIERIEQVLPPASVLLPHLCVPICLASLPCQCPDAHCSLGAMRTRVMPVTLGMSEVRQV